MNQKSLRIATRKSQLALWQANHIKQMLLAWHPHLTITLIPLSTEGDRRLDARLADFGGKGLFVKEIEQALLSDQADIAVHSMKDLPVDFPLGLTLGAICQREDPRDVLIAHDCASLDALPAGARVGTASLRRQCQLRRYRDDLCLIDLRGNVDTRLRKLDEGQLDAIILAAAGIRRLGLTERISGILPENIFIPAVGQGALGIECRTQDNEVMDLIAPLHHTQTAACVLAERAMNAQLGGGCHAPIAAYAHFDEQDILRLTGMVANPFTGEYLEDQVSGDDPHAVGVMLAEKLLAKGAKRILSSC
jgi:porphobilinogen deaminase